MSESLGKTPGYARYSGYDTKEQEDEYLDMLGPIWRDGDPAPLFMGRAIAGRASEKFFRGSGNKRGQE
jgi:hypothetical protein